MNTKVMRHFTILITMLMLVACGNSQRDTEHSNDFDEIKMTVDYQPTDFNDWIHWFNGFDPEHVYNFHYAILSDNRHDIPGQQMIE